MVLKNWLGRFFKRTKNGLTKPSHRFKHVFRKKGEYDQ